mgnify:CR=1 FL=1
MAQPHPVASAEIRETVYFYDTDCGGVMSNIAYLRFVEKARTALFDGLGMPASAMMESGVFPAVVRTEIDYRSPARLGETVGVSVVLDSVEKVRAVCRFHLSVDSADGEPRLVAEAIQVVVLVQMPEGRPRRMPTEWLGVTG